MTRDAFNEIIHKNNRKLFTIAYRMLHNRQEAEDVVQDVFVKMWTMGDKLDKYNDISALGVTITKNNCLDMLRKWKHISSEEDEFLHVDADPSPSPLEKIVTSEDKNILDRIIEELPPLYRDIVQLREIDGLSYEEIAATSNVNINTLRVTLSRARQIIKEKYLKYSDDRE